MDPIIKIKCHACDQDCTIEQAPGQIINHKLALSSRLVSVTEQLAGIKKKEVPIFLQLTKEKESLEMQLRIWNPLSEKAQAVLSGRGIARASSHLPISHKDPG